MYNIKPLFYFLLISIPQYSKISGFFSLPKSYLTLFKSSFHKCDYRLLLLRNSSNRIVSAHSQRKLECSQITDFPTTLIFISSLYSAVAAHLRYLCGWGRRDCQLASAYLMADMEMQQESTRRVNLVDGVGFKVFLTYSVLWTFRALIGCRAEKQSRIPTITSSLAFFSSYYSHLARYYNKEIIILSHCMRSHLTSLFCVLTLIF